MDHAIIFIFFLLGLIFGSFFNVIGLRLPQNIPFSNDRSACPHCSTQLSWYENIPLLSFLLQVGKCRHCKRRISFIYPAVEMFTGGLFAVSYIQFGLEWELLTALLLVSMLMIVLVADIAYMLIPNKVLLFFLPLLIGMRIIVPLDPWWSPLAGGLIGVAVVALIILVSRGGMGAGDMKLFGVLGIVLGTEKLLLAFFLSCTIGALIGLVLLVGKLIDRKQPVPFGPYIVVAALISFFYGEELIRFYFQFYI